MAEENLRNEMIIWKNKRKLCGKHGPRTEYQKLTRLGKEEGRDRKFQLGSMPLCSVLFNSLLQSASLLDVSF